VVDLDSMMAEMPFAATIGVKLLEASPERCLARLDWAPQRCTAAGVMHGGALMTLADSVAALCAFLSLPPGASTATIESKTNFFRGVRDGHVEASSRPLHIGRTTIVVQTDLVDADGRLVAQTTQTQAVVGGSRPAP
jgi:uncharacterized protein (TIGR00369 family)